jgi:hypothetical protein
VYKKKALAAKMVPCDGLWVLKDVLFCALSFLFFLFLCSKNFIVIESVSFFGLLVTVECMCRKGLRGSVLSTDMKVRAGYNA